MKVALVVPEGASGIIQASPSTNVYEISGPTIEVDELDVPGLLSAGYTHLPDLAPPVEEVAPAPEPAPEPAPAPAPAPAPTPAPDAPVESDK